MKKLETEHSYYLFKLDDMLAKKKVSINKIMKETPLKRWATPEEIALKMDQSQEKMQENIEKYTGITFREPTEEEQSLIDSGKATKAEIFEKILNETIEAFLREGDETPSEGKAPTEGKVPSDEKKPSNSDNSSQNTPYNRIVTEYTGKLYGIKGKYMSMLDGLISQADNEFHALPKEQWTTSNRSKIISKYIGVASGYESSCDAEVNALLSEFKSKLSAIGGDTSIVSAMKEVYYEEKSLKISYYTSQLK